jgi:nitroreductase
MTLYDAIAKRRSVRKFQDRDVPDHLLAEAMSLAGRGPSAGAIRGYKGIVIRPGLAYGSPASVVICIDEAAYEKRYGERGRTLYAIQDAAIYGAYLGLLLVERGLCSVWVGAFREERVRRAIGTELRPVAIIAVGYEA